jgi:hypothetical protein
VVTTFGAELAEPSWREPATARELELV